MSEQIADQMSKSGGIGIAEQVYKASLDKMRNGGTPNASTDENARAKSVSMIDQFERKSF